MPPQPAGRLLRRSVLIAAIATAPFAGAAPAGAAIPPAPGNLIANWGFDTNTAGWGSFGGSLVRTLNGSPCSTTNPGAATAVRQTGDVYTISDSQGSGNLPTVRSTVAGETFIAYARVSAASSSAAGKPGRIILRERVGATGSILKETAVSFTLPPVGQWAFPVVSATATTSGATMGLRIEQSAAVAGDAFTADDIFLRRAAQAFGPASPGTLWTAMSNDLSRVSLFSAPGPGLNHDSTSRLLDRLRVYVDGKGGATGSQRLRAVAYHGDGFGWAAGMFLDGVSREVTVTSGTSGRWVDFRFDRPVFLGGWDGASYQFGLLSGGARNVARYASTSSPAALWWGPDSYADGALASVPPASAALGWSTDDKQMSIQGIAVPLGEAGDCF